MSVSGAGTKVRTNMRFEKHKQKKGLDKAVTKLGEKEEEWRVELR